MSKRLPPSARLKKAWEFEAVQRDGRKLYSRCFLLLVRSAERGKSSRIGLTVSRRVSLKATERNLIKRRFRETFRKIVADLRQPIEIVVIAKSAAVEMSFAELESQFQMLLRKGGYLG